MEGKVIGPGPYRATKLWNETIKMFRGGMPLRRHWAHFRSYNCSFTGSEAVDWLHELLRRNDNFGPEVTRCQTAQLLRKFLKTHVIEDIKGRYGNEDFFENGQLYRFPALSPLKHVPTRTLLTDSNDLQRPIYWDDYEDLPQQEKIVPMKSAALNSEMWNKRHSVAIGDLNECKLIRRKEITPKQVDHIWKSMTVAHLQRVLGLKTMDGVLDPARVNAKHIVHNVFSVNKTGIVVLKNNAEDMPHWVYSAMKCLAKWPNGNETKQPMYPGFERDVLKTVADYFQKLKEPLLTFHLYDVFVNILSLLQQQNVAVEALQVSCLLLPPASRRHLQLLLRFMAQVCQNPALPSLNNSIVTRTLMVQMFSHCVLGSADEVDLDELLATKLVTFMLEHHDTVLQVPSKLHHHVEEHLFQLRRIKYAGAEADSPMASQAFRQHISRLDFEEQRVLGSKEDPKSVTESLIADRKRSSKDKRRRLKQFQKSYLENNPESRASVLREKTPQLKQQLMFFKFKKSFQPFQRSWSFRT
ncbi:DEP domain-containing protein 1B-like [Polymixia lowei]